MLNTNYSRQTVTNLEFVMHNAMKQEGNCHMFSSVHL